MMLPNGAGREQLRNSLAALSVVHRNELTAPQRTLLSAYKQVTLENLGWIAEVMGSRHHAPVGLRSALLDGVLIKPVGNHCNLRCRYCYEGAHSDVTKNSKMPDELLRLVVKDVLECSGRKAEFVWHGGEPLLAGIEFFERALDIQRTESAGDKIVTNSIQTSGVLLDDAWAAFFAKNSFRVGISLDAPQDVHDRYRVSAKGFGTYADACLGLEALQRHNVDHGVIVVVGANHADRHSEMLRELVELGVRSFDIHPACGNGTSNEFDVEAKVFSEFASGLFDEWLSTEPYIEVTSFTDVLRYLQGTAPVTCYFAGRCSSIAAIEANGDVIPCTRPFDSHWTFGNLFEHRLSQIIQDDRFREFARRDQRAQAEHIDCRWHGLCHNGCPQHRRDTNRADISGAGIFCDCSSDRPRGWPALFDHIEKRVHEVVASE